MEGPREDGAGPTNAPWGELELAREALRSSGIGAWTWDVAREEVLWSDGVPELLGISREEFGGTYEAYLAFLPAEASTLLSKAVEGCLRGEIDDYVIEHPLGGPVESRRWMECRGRIWRSPEGKPLRMAGIIIDITARRRLAEERDRLHEELARARHLESLGRLAGGVAHDFNNLLTIILGYAELAMRQGASGRLGLTALSEIASAATKASDLTGKLLAFARRQEIAPDHEDVGLLVRELEGLLARTAGERVTLELHTAEEPLIAYVDRGQLEQVLINLVANARDAMPRGGRVRVSVEPEEGGGAGGDRAVSLRVVDEGCGMDEETRRRAFEPFFTTKPRDVGTGLGLASALGVIRQAGGSIELRSEPGRGTEVLIVLPRSDHAASTRAEPGASAGVGVGSVLLVEDNDAVRGVAARALEEHGYTVIEARDANVALERAAGCDRLTAAVIDVILPGISGVELAAELDRRAEALPIVFVSGLSEEHPTDEHRVGSRRFLRKPFAPRELVSAVEQVLRPTPE